MELPSEVSVLREILDLEKLHSCRKEVEKGIKYTKAVLRESHQPRKQFNTERELAKLQDQATLMYILLAHRRGKRHAKRYITHTHNGPQITFIKTLDDQIEALKQYERWLRHKKCLLWENFVKEGVGVEDNTRVEKSQKPKKAGNHRSILTRVFDTVVSAFGVT